MKAGRRFLLWLGMLLAAYSLPLYQLIGYSFSADLHSHIVLIPIVSAYLIYLERARLPRPGKCCWVGGLFTGIAGLAALASALIWRKALGSNDYFSLIALSFVCLVAAGGFLWMGAAWMRAAVFPMSFLIFFVPMPAGMELWLENMSKLASAEVADWFFRLSGIPFLRSGQIFELPGIALEVAQECSGIRSSWVLFITGLLASYLFLRTAWKRAALVLFVLPLAIVRNAFRILVIGVLCTEWGPDMIDSVIHRQGGPGFFVLSLVPLALLAYWLRRSETGADAGPADLIALQPKKN